MRNRSWNLKLLLIANLRLTRLDYKLNVLSLFDGISCGQLALHRAGIRVDKYFASEIEKASIKITTKNFPNTIHLGDVCDVKASDLPKIDLLIGGSPCQSVSGAVSLNSGLDGKSKLFFEYVRLLKELNPTYFLLENVIMKKEWELLFNEYMGCEPVYINSNGFSAQDRPRLYWTNIPFDTNLPVNNLILGDIISPTDDKYFYKESFSIVNKGAVEAILDIKGHDILKRVNSKSHKCQCLTAVCGGNQQKKVIDNDRVRKLTPLEYERLQTVPDNYTEGVCDGARYKALGNGWTVDVIAWIFRGIKC